MHARDQEDDNDWVQEQIRKGVGLGQSNAHTPPPSAAAFAQSAGGGAILTAKAAATEVSRSGDAAMQSLLKTLERLKASLLSPLY